LAGLGLVVGLQGAFELPMCGYLLQNPDGRVLFALPFHEQFTLLGTTDQEVQDPHAAATEAEVDYLLQQASRWLRAPVTRADVRHVFSGVRPLLDDGKGDAKAVTRDYRLDLVQSSGAPRLDVWGGKLTTFRLLAEQAADQLAPLLQAPRGAWTADAPLPDTRYRSGRNEGVQIAPGVWEEHLRHCVEAEWAQTAEDFLWRRTKLGLALAPAEVQAVRDWFSR
jgi:glycerol-3-phosphate dehydrogenase